MRSKITNQLLKELPIKKSVYEIFDSDIKGFVLRVEPSGTLTYYLAYTNAEGRRRRFRIGRHGNLTVAQAREAAKLAAAKATTGVDIQAERFSIRETAQKTRAQTLSVFIQDKYEPWAILERKTGASTVHRIKARFDEFLSYPMVDINAWNITRWRMRRLKENIKKTTINRDVSVLRACLGKAVEWGVIEYHPLANLKPLRIDSNRIIRYLDDEEEKRLRSSLSERDRKIKTKRANANTWREERSYTLLPNLFQQVYADHLTPMVLIAMNTGIRRGELLDLHWKHFNEQTKTITIMGDTAKSGKTRHIPLNIEVMNVLKAWANQTKAKKNERIFPGRDGGRRVELKRAWGNLLDAAKIQDFRWHDLRHHFASKLVMNGVPLNTVRELLGHSDLMTTLRYAHLAPDHKAEAVETLSNLK